MPPKPDMSTHTLTHFLDRFVYRNAKAATGGSRGSSIMQPLAGGRSEGILLTTRGMRHGQQPVNSESFWRKKIEDVEVDEVFFHKYFNRIGKGKTNSNKSKNVAKTLQDGDDEEDNEDEIWQALVDSKSEIEGNNDEDSDLDMLDLDDSDAESLMGSVGTIGEEDEDSISIGSETEELDMSEGEDSSPEGEDESRMVHGAELEGEELPKTDEKVGDSRREKRRKLKNLPTFASVDDYAGMLGGDSDDGGS